MKFFSITMELIINIILALDKKVTFPFNTRRGEIT